MDGYCMETAYLIRAINDMYEIVYPEFKPTEENLLRLFGIGCAALVRLRRDPIFRHELKYFLHGGKRIYSEELYKTMNDLRIFSKFLTEIERDILVKSGFKEEVADVLLFKSITLYESLNKGCISWNDFKRGCDFLQQDICNKYAYLSERRYDRGSIPEMNHDPDAFIRSFCKKGTYDENVIVLNAKVGQKEIETYINDFIFLLGGAAIVGINGSSFALSCGLTTPLVYLSQAIGSGLMGAIFGKYL
jgi:hypothetical protein